METDDRQKCPECGCRMEWAECEVCGGKGVDGHDCGEDCCCCADPEDNIACDCCLGEGGWWVCEACTSNSALCDKKGAGAGVREGIRMHTTDQRCNMQ